jgi:hypothetical protein
VGVVHVGAEAGPSGLDTEDSAVDSVTFCAPRRRDPLEILSRLLGGRGPRRRTRLPAEGGLLRPAPRYRPPGARKVRAGQTRSNGGDRDLLKDHVLLQVREDPSRASKHEQPQAVRQREHAGQNGIRPFGVSPRGGRTPGDIAFTSCVNCPCRNATRSAPATSRTPQGRHAVRQRLRAARSSGAKVRAGAGSSRSWRKPEEGPSRGVLCPHERPGRPSRCTSSTSS